MPNEVDAITKLYDFLLWIIPKLEKFPRSQKFLIADRIETALLDVLNLLIKAAYSKKNPNCCSPRIWNLNDYATSSGCPRISSSFRSKTANSAPDLLTQLAPRANRNRNNNTGFRCARTLIFFMMPDSCLSRRTGERIIEVQALLLCWPFGQPKHRLSLPGLVTNRRTSGQGTLCTYWIRQPICCVENGILDSTKYVRVKIAAINFSLIHKQLRYLYEISTSSSLK